MPVMSEKPKINSRWADRFEKTRENIPRTLADWEISATARNNQIYIQITPPNWFKKELSEIEFYPEQIGIVNHTALQSLRKSQGGYILEKFIVLRIQLAP